MSSNQPINVPLCDLGAQYQEIRTDVEAAVTRVLNSGQVILGPEVAALEREVADYCGAAEGIGCGSGTDALLLALHGLEIGPGDEVILPPFTFFATVGSVLRCGATPVFADIDPITFNIDPKEIAAKVTDKTKAIMPVHLYGQCADMEPIWKIAEKNNLVVIEDAAQAIGAEYQGKKTGTLGGIACFSFYPSKNLGTYGDAGLVTTDNPAWAARMKALRVHGMEPKYYHKYLGWNARIDAIQAAILRVKLPHLERWTIQRQAAAERYDELIEATRLHRFMQRPAVMEGRRHVYNQYVVRVPVSERDTLMQHMRQNGVSCEIYYPLPLHLQECISHLNYRPGDFPISEEACHSVIALPMFPEITALQQQRVVDVCAGYRMKQTRVAA
ncbi:MAG: DegT/DnrJ/EryC1/StrS family aminotransferase [Planctomycetes bacterium]|nr:DegT/DnrJ/EryC1/StrS family aminotransferase [Planctomycetota bacterium]